MSRYTTPWDTDPAQYPDPFADLDQQNFDQSADPFADLDEQGNEPGYLKRLGKRIYAGWQEQAGGAIAGMSRELQTERSLADRYGDTFQQAMSPEPVPDGTSAIGRFRHYIDQGGAPGTPTHTAKLLADLIHDTATDAAQETSERLPEGVLDEVETVGESLYDRGQQTREQAGEFDIARPEGFQPVQAVKHYGTQALESLGGNVAPAMAIGFLTRGRVSTLNERRAAQGLAPISENVATQVAGLGTMGGQVWGQEYERSFRESGDHEAAVDEANMRMFAEVVPEIIPFGIAMKTIGPGVFSKAVRKMGGVQKAAGQIAAGTLSEGASEVLTEIIHEAYNSQELGQEIDFEDFRTRMFDAFMVGALMGAGMNIPAALSNIPGEDTSRLDQWAREFGARDLVDPATVTEENPSGGGFNLLTHEQVYLPERDDVLYGGPGGAPSAIRPTTIAPESMVPPTGPGFEQQTPEPPLRLDQRPEYIEGPGGERLEPLDLEGRPTLPREEGFEGMDPAPQLPEPDTTNFGEFKSDQDFEAYFEGVAKPTREEIAQIRKQSEGNLLQVIARKFDGLSMDAWAKEHGVDVKGARQKGGVNWIAGFGNQLFSRHRRAKTPDQLAEALTELWAEDPMGIGPEYMEETPDGRMVFTANSVGRLIDDAIRDPDRFGDAAHIAAQSKAQELAKFESEMIRGWEEYKERSAFNEQFKDGDPELFAELEPTATHEKSFYNENWDTESRALADWFAEAREQGVNPEALEALADRSLPPAEQVKQIHALIEAHDEQAAAEEADRPRDTGPRRPEAGRGLPAEAERLQKQEPQGPSQELTAPLYIEWMGRRLPVESVDEARRKWAEFRDTSEAGVSQIGNGLDVFASDGTKIGRISYNGRWWPEEGADLLGDDTRKQQALTDLEREKDEARSGRSGEDTVPVEAGAGDLFSGASKQQDLLTDESGLPRTAPKTQSEIDEAANEAATSSKNDLEQPTRAQKEAGNYKKGHLSLHGLNITIENPKGSMRRGDGWKVRLKDHYGYIKRTEGADAEQVDVFLGPEARDPNPRVAIVDQRSRNGQFDEHKVIIGFESGKAEQTYARNYSPGFIKRSNVLAALSEVSLDELKDWLENGDLSKPYSEETFAKEKQDVQQQEDEQKSQQRREADRVPRQEAGTGRQRQKPDGERLSRPTGQQPQDRPVDQPERGEGRRELLTETGEGETSPPIEDFGEVIEGARKHYAQEYLERLKEAGEQDVAAVPLSKSWPQPDYGKLLEEGAEPWSVAFVHAARDEVPPKPRKRWKLAGWTKQVGLLRDFADQLISGEITAERVQTELSKDERGTFDRLVSRIDLYLAVGHDKSLKGLYVTKGRYSIKNGKTYDPPKIIWTVSGKAKSTALSNWPTDHAEGATRSEAIANFRKAVKSGALDKKPKRAIRFGVYSKRGEGKTVFIGKKIGRDVARLKDFSSLDEARKYLQENQDELQDLLKKYKAVPSMRREKNKPRVGADHRNGGDVNPEQFQEAFGFRGVQFGNYVEQQRRQEDLNNAYDSLMDLAGILDIPPRALSLNGELGLAFGARGKGGKRAAAAHYEGDHIVINLTKRRGAGSLAHEWWHGLDNYFSRMGGKKGDYLTERHEPSIEGVRDEMREAFRQVMQAVNQAGIRQRSKKLDRRRTKAYWSTGREMTARAFESYVIAKLDDQGIANDYLANIVSEDYWKAAAALGLELEDTYPYPQAAELPSIRAAFDSFFETIEAVETDEGTVMLRDQPGVYLGYERETRNLQVREERASPAEQAQLALDLPAAPTVPEQRAQLEANFNTHYRRTPTGEIRVGVDRVTTPEEAAHVLASLRKRGEEVFYAMVLGADGEVLDLQFHHKGIKEAATVSLGVVIPAIAAVPGATHVYFAHNHPTGDPSPSAADHRITEELVTALDGTGISAAHVVIGRHGKAASFEQFGPVTEIDIKPRVRNRTVPITEKTVRRIPPKDRIKLETPAASRTYTQNIDADNAIVLLDNRHSVIGAMALAESEMENLRGTGSVRRILTAIDQTNASAAVIKAQNEEGAVNVSRFLNANQSVRVLDAIVEGRSLAENIGFPDRGPWFHRGGVDLGFSHQKKPSTERGQITWLSKQLESVIGRYLKKKLPEGTYRQVPTPKPHRTAVKAVERVFGRRVVFFNAGPGSPKFFNGVLLSEDTKTLYVNIDSNNPFMGVVGHELLHSIRREQPDLYDSLAMMAKDYLKEGGFHEWAAELDRRLIPGEPRQTTDRVYEEMVANVLGDAFLDEAYISRLEKEGGASLLERLWQTILNIIDQLLGRMKSRNMGSSKYFHDIELLKKRVQETLRDVKKPQPRGPGASPQRGTVDFSREASQDPFYSMLVDTVEKAEGMPKKGKPEAFKQWLDGQQRKGNLKQEERDWMGVDQWLEAQDTVTRDALQEFVRDNQVQVKEVLFGGPATGGSAEESTDTLLAVLDDWLEREEIDYGEDTPAELLERDDLSQEQRHYLEAFNRRLTIAAQNGVVLPDDQELTHRAGGWVVVDESGQAITGFHPTPDEALGEWEYAAEMEGADTAGNTQYGTFTLPGGRHYRELLLTLPPRADRDSQAWKDEAERRYQSEDIPNLSEAQRQIIDHAVSPSTFRSTHFQQPNTLAHVRFNERTDEDGNRVLFIEEIQSDWHQRGRKGGYQDPKDNPVRARLAEVEQRLKEIHGMLAKEVGTEEKALWREQEQLRKQIGPGAVPDAPFKKSWPMLAFKRMIRWAVENGYDSIAWTTGEQQVDRYDLSKHVDRIEYEPAGNGLYEVYAYAHDGSVSLWEDEIDIDRVEELLGKEIAEKIRNGEGAERADAPMRDWRVLSGLDLKIGGDGMVGFYDQILPREVSKYVKKWGAKVGRTMLANDGSMPDSAWDGIKDSAKGVHSIAVNPAMRESAMEGQPMFHRQPREAARTFREALEDIGKIYSDRAQRFIDVWNTHIGGFYDVLGHLPKRDDYLIRRYETLGKIGKTEDLTERIYQAFENASEADRQATFDYLTTAGARPTAIKNAAVRSNAVKLKKMIDQVGRRLVDAGLLAQESYDEYKDAYLPRLYLKHLLTDDAFHALGAGKHVSGLGYLKKRKDIPPEVRAVILGEITDPGFLASVGVGRALRDMAVLDFLDDVSTDETWVHPRGLVEWGGRKVTVFWLQDEANRLRNQSRHMKPDLGGKARKLSDQMQDVVESVKEVTGKDVSDYRQIPLTPQYGRLRGMWVRKEIYDDVRGVSGYQKADHSFFESLLGFGGIGTKVTRWWKLSKVALNMPTQSRNAVSNLVLLHLSGVPAHRIPGLMVEAVGQMLNGGPAWKIAKKYGITQATFSNNELVKVHRNLTDIRLKMAVTKQQRAALQLRAMLEMVAEAGGDIYQIMEATGKTAKIIYELERGTSPARAALAAHKALFDYSLVPRTVGYLRNVPFGMPFITFYYKALPRLLEVAVKYPWRYLPYVVLPYIWTQMLAQMYDVDDDDIEKLRKAFPKWLQERKHVYIMPWKDEHGRWLPFDFSYFLPWTAYFDVGRELAKGDVAEGFRDTGLFSGPIIDMISALRTNVDPFTKKEIVNEFDPPGKKIMTLLGYVWTMAMPTMLTEHGAAGKLWEALALDDGASMDEELRPRHTVPQALVRIIGVNTYAIDPEMSREENMRRMEYEIQQVRRRMTRELSAPNLSPEKAERIELQYREEIDRRIEQLVEYDEQSEVHPNLRTE